MDGFMGLPNSLVANLHFTGMVANRATGGMLFNDWIPQGSLEMQPVTKTKAKSTTENTKHKEKNWAKRQRQKQPWIGALTFGRDASLARMGGDAHETVDCFAPVDAAGSWAATPGWARAHLRGRVPDGIVANACRLCSTSVCHASGEGQRQAARDFCSGMAEL